MKKVAIYKKYDLDEEREIMSLSPQSITEYIKYYWLHSDEGKVLCNTLTGEKVYTKIIVANEIKNWTEE